MIVYILACPETGAVRYVGVTKNLEKRRHAHITCEKETAKWPWIASLKARGLRPVIEEIERYDDLIDAENAERFWIAYFRFLGFQLFNRQNGGISSYSVCEESRINMSNAQRGKRMLEEAKRKIGLAHLGHPVSAETRRTIGDAHRGRKQSPELLARLSLIRRGKRASATARENMRIAGLARWARERANLKIQPELQIL